MKKLQQAILITAGCLGLLLALSFAGESDLQDAIERAEYGAELVQYRADLQAHMTQVEIEQHCQKEKIRC